MVFFIRFMEKYHTPLIANNIKDYLQKVIKSQSFAHAYLFTGPEQTNKEKTALYLAQTILCSTDMQKEHIPCGICDHCKQVMHHVHPDLFIVEKDEANKNIGIEQIRDLLRRLSLHSFIATHKVVFINAADLMTEEAANALLKTLEEPSGKTVLILVAKHTKSLPETIISRCQIIRFSYLTKSEFFNFSYGCDLPNTTAEKYFRLSKGLPELIESNFKNNDFWQNMLTEINDHLNLYGDSLPNKFNYIKNLLKNKKTNIAKNQLVFSEVDIWLYILRDMLFIKLNLDNFLLFSEHSARFKKISYSLNTNTIFTQLQKVLQLQKQTDANTNAQLTLENLYLSLN